MKPKYGDEQVNTETQTICESLFRSREGYDIAVTCKTGQELKEKLAAIYKPDNFSTEQRETIAHVQAHTNWDQAIRIFHRVRDALTEEKQGGQYAN